MSGFLTLGDAGDNSAAVEMFANSIKNHPNYLFGVTGETSKNNTVVNGSNVVSTQVFEYKSAARFSTVGNSNSIFLSNSSVLPSDHQHPTFGFMPALVLRGANSSQCAALTIGSSSDLAPLGVNRDGLTFFGVVRPRKGGSGDTLRRNNLFSMSQTNSATTLFLQAYLDETTNPMALKVELKDADGGTLRTVVSNAVFTYDEWQHIVIDINYNEQYGSDSGRVTIRRNRVAVNDFTGVFPGRTAAPLSTAAYQTRNLGATINPNTATRNDWFEGDFIAFMYTTMSLASIQVEERAIMNLCLYGAAENGPTDGPIYVPVAVHLGPGDSNSADSGLYPSNIPAAPLLSQMDQRRLINKILAKLPGGFRNAGICHGSHGATLCRTFGDFTGERGGVAGFNPPYGHFPVILWEAGRNDLASTGVLAVTGSGTANTISFDAGDPWSGYANTHPYRIFFGSTAIGLTANTQYWLNRNSANVYSIHTTVADAIAATNPVDITADGANSVVVPTPANLYAVTKDQINSTKAHATMYQSWGKAPLCFPFTLICVNDQTIQANINAYNTLLRNGKATADINCEAIIDIAADSRYDDYLDCENLTWFKSDKVHTNADGIDSWATIAANTIIPFIPTY